MLQDVEQILDFWDSQGILLGSPHRIKIAWMVESQRQVNKWMTESARNKNQRCELDRNVTHTLLAAIMHIGENQPDVFLNTMEIKMCTNVYCLGPWPRGDWDDRRKKISMRVAELVKAVGQIAFGGFTLKDGRIYLLAAPSTS